jgi:hypothetical protein
VAVCGRLLRRIGKSILGGKGAGRDGASNGRGGKEAASDGG